MMTDYSNLSDGEINMAVAKLMGTYRYVPENLPCDRHLGRNYCNSWADAGPIILENCISMVWDCAEDASSAWWNAFDKFDDCRIQYQANPLRAAMIVFLMMNEGE